MMDNDGDAYLLSEDDNIEFDTDQEVSVLFNRDDEVGDGASFGESEPSSHTPRSPVSVGGADQPRRVNLTTSRPLKHRKLDLSKSNLGQNKPRQTEPAVKVGIELVADQKRIINLAFKIATKQYGFIIQANAAKEIYLWLKMNGLTGKCDEPKTEVAIRAICDRARSRYSGTAILDVNSVSGVLKEFNATYGLTEEGAPVTGPNFSQGLNDSMSMLELQDQLRNDQVIDITKYFRCIDAFEMPNLRYDKSTKTFALDPNRPKIILAGHEKAEAYNERYQFLKARVLRNEVFAPASAFSSGSSRLELTSIKSLLGRVDGRFCLFGMLVQQVNETYAIADGDASVQLKFLEDCVRYGRGLFTENSFILVEGEMTEEEVFNVHSITLPPFESRAQTESNYDHIPWLGRKVVPTPPVQLIRALSTEFSDISIVLISHVHLDKAVVFRGLRKLFSTLETDGTPLAVVMLGSFTSAPLSSDGSSVDAYADGFKRLGNLVAEFTNLSKWCRFIMVPGPNDPHHINALPLAPLPKLYHVGFSSKVANVTFTSNPARIQVADRHLVVMRYNLLNKVLRNIFLPLPERAASNPATIQKYFVRTVVDSSHLVPLPLNVQPILLAHDNALRLHCNPHLLVLSDETPAFSTDYKDTKFVNPGAFVPTSPHQSINYFSYFPFQDALEQRYLSIDD